MTLDAVKVRLDAIEKKMDSAEAHLAEVLAAVVALQRGQLRLLGAGSLLGGCLIFAMSRALGL